MALALAVWLVDVAWIWASVWVFRFASFGVVVVSGFLMCAITLVIGISFHRARRPAAYYVLAGTACGLVCIAVVETYIVGIANTL